jgi:hypothetical protein
MSRMRCGVSPVGSVWMAFVVAVVGGYSPGRADGERSPGEWRIE